MWKKIRGYLVVAGGAILATLLFIAGRRSGPAGSQQRSAHQNHKDLRRQLDSDRDRAEETRADLDRKRQLIAEERELSQQGRESTDRVGSIIDNAGEAVAGVLSDPGTDDEG